MATITLHEALKFLGADVNTDADQLRRLYLRLTKTYRPETDPDGFMQLREAFEVATQSAHATAALSFKATLEAEPETRPEPAPEIPPLDMEFATRRSQPPASGGTEASGMERYLQTLERLPPHAHDERVRVARMATEAYPESEKARGWLVTALDYAGRLEEAADVLRATKDESGDWVRALTAQFPDQLTDEDLRAFHGHFGLSELRSLCWKMLEGFGVLAASARAFCLLLEVDEHRGFVPDPTRMLHLLLTLHESGELELATRLTNLLESSEVFGTVDFELASHWVRIKGLAILDESLPQPLRVALVRAIENDDPMWLVLAAERFIRDEPERAEKVRTQMMEDAPALHKYSEYFALLPGVASVACEFPKDADLTADDPRHLELLMSTRADLDTLHPGAHMAAIELCRGCVDAIPDSVVARGWLVAALETAGQIEDAAEALREGYRLGRHQWLDELVCRLPSAVNEEDARLIRAAYSGRVFWMLFRRLLNTGHLLASSRVARAALEGDPDRRLEEPEIFLKVLLHLHSEGYVEIASKLTARCVAWVAAFGIDTDWEALWGHVLQLDQLPSDFNRSARRIVANAIIHDDRQGARSAARVLKRNDPRAAALVASQLRATAGLREFAKLFTGTADPSYKSSSSARPKVTTASRQSTAGSNVATVAAMALAVFLFVGGTLAFDQCSGRGSGPNTVAHQRTPMLPTLPARWPAAGAPRNPAQKVFDNTQYIPVPTPQIPGSYPVVPGDPFGNNQGYRPMQGARAPYQGQGYRPSYGGQGYRPSPFGPRPRSPSPRANSPYGMQPNPYGQP